MSKVRINWKKVWEEWNIFVEKHAFTPISPKPKLQHLIRKHMRILP